MKLRTSKQAQNESASANVKASAPKRGRSPSKPVKPDVSSDTGGLPIKRWNKIAFCQRLEKASAEYVRIDAKGFDSEVELARAIREERITRSARKDIQDSQSRAYIAYRLFPVFASTSRYGEILTDPAFKSAGVVGKNGSVKFIAPNLNGKVFAPLNNKAFADTDEGKGLARVKTFLSSWQARVSNLDTIGDVALRLEAHGIKVERDVPSMNRRKLNALPAAWRRACAEKGLSVKTAKDRPAAERILVAIYKRALKMSDAELREYAKDADAPVRKSRKTKASDKPLERSRRPSIALIVGHLTQGHYGADDCLKLVDAAQSAYDAIKSKAKASASSKGKRVSKASVDADVDVDVDSPPDTDD